MKELPYFYSACELLLASPAGNEVKYQDDHCQHQQDMNQAAANVTKEPY
jgi:hypothetical protein